MKEKYLPIGTVVTLEGATKRIMIVGYCPIVEGTENQVYDYSACTFPEGMISADKTLAFNHSQINKIEFMGLEDEEQTNFSTKIKEMVSGIQKMGNIKFPDSSPVKNDLPQNNISKEVPVLDINKPADNQVNSIEDIMKS